MIRFMVEARCSCCGLKCMAWHDEKEPMCFVCWGKRYLHVDGFLATFNPADNEAMKIVEKIGRAEVAELVDAPDSKPGDPGREGSSPSLGTNILVLLLKKESVYTLAAIAQLLGLKTINVYPGYCAVHAGKHTVFLMTMDYVMLPDIAHGVSMDAAIVVGKMHPDADKFVDACLVNTRTPIILKL